VEIRALTINEVIKAGLTIAREVLGSVNRYCVYEGDNEVIIEYWRGKELSVKLIYANDPARALMRFYDAEKAGLRVSTRIAALTTIFTLTTYTVLNIQICIGDSPIFNKTLGLDSPLIIGSDNLYVNLVAIITDAVGRNSLLSTRQG